MTRERDTERRKSPEKDAADARHLAKTAAITKLLERMTFKEQVEWIDRLIARARRKIG